jgi:hypothetical protein
MARIVTVYYPGLTRFALKDMSFIRWLKISDALARRGHQVDIAVDEPFRLSWWLKGRPKRSEYGLRRIRLTGLDFSRYDVVKTLFHIGFEVLERAGADSHPFIISKLGSVVGPRDMDGIYFYGSDREKQFETQTRIAQSARYVTVLSEPAATLWRETVSRDSQILLVPGAVDRHIPGPATDPFPAAEEKRCLFSGNIYTRSSQPEANALLVAKLNELGERLSRYDIRLYFQGVGDTTELNTKWVSNLGPVNYDKSWQALHHADVGIVVSAGTFMHNNESTKIYHYLRAGLPVVCESGFPNDHVVETSGLGFLAENGDMKAMASKINDASGYPWDRKAGIQYVLDHHTWDKRAEIYDKVIREQIPNSGD